MSDAPLTAGRRALCGGLGAALLARSAPSSAGPTLIRPAPADAFVDSVGVCTHLASPPYDRRFPTLLRALAVLGVRYLRDELRPTDDLARWRELHGQIGIRSHLLVSPATNTVAEMLDYVRALGVGRIAAIEGQNEGDSDWFKAQPSAGPDWARAVTRYQRDIYTALRARYDAASLPVLSPTVLDYKPGDVRRLLGAAPFCDMVALHAYVQAGQEPETGDADAGLDWYVREVGDRFKPGAPAMVTEAGYQTGAHGVSAAAAAIYLPRLLLHAFSRGIRRTFLYELMDEGTGSDPEQNYGLLTSDGRPKPAYATLRVLLQELADAGPAAAGELLGPPPALLEGPADARVSVFKKRSGDCVLALWRARRSFDRARGRDLPASPASARVQVPAEFAAASWRSLAGDDWAPAAMLRGVVTVAISDTVGLLRLTR